MENVPGISDVRINRDRAARARHPNRPREDRPARPLDDPRRLGDRDGLAGTRATVLRRGGREYDIFVRLKEGDRRSARGPGELSVSATGETVPLRSVIEVNHADGPVAIDRKDQERVLYVSGNYAGRPSARSRKTRAKRSVRSRCPKAFAIVFGGEYEEQQKANRELLFTLLLAIVLVYMVMAGQFESLRDPFVVLFSIPMALIGISVTLFSPARCSTCRLHRHAHARGDRRQQRDPARRLHEPATAARRDGTARRGRRSRTPAAAPHPHDDA